MREVLQQVEGLPKMLGGYDLVTTDAGEIYLVGWCSYDSYYRSKPAPTREEAIANMRIELAKQRVLGG